MAFYMLRDTRGERLLRIIDKCHYRVNELIDALKGNVGNSIKQSR